MKDIKKVTLIGLGAMGVFFAPRISEKLGADFRILADGARKERLERKGVTVNTINYRFPIITPDVEGDPADLVIIAVKGYDLEQAIKDIRNQVGKDTIILSVLNGVESEKQVAAVYGRRTCPVFLHADQHCHEGRKDRVRSSQGSIHFGDLKNDPEHYSENVLAVKNLFDLCGIDYKIDADMLKGIWFKFMCNVAENMTCAMFGVPFGSFQKSDDANYLPPQGHVGSDPHCQ